MTVPQLEETPIKCTLLEASSTWSCVVCKQGPSATSVGRTSRARRPLSLSSRRAPISLCIEYMSGSLAVEAGSDGCISEGF